MPAAVYWRRRLAVLSAALVLVLAVGKLLGSGSDGSSDGAIEPAGSGDLATPTSTVSAAGTASPGERSGKGKGKKGKKGKGGKGGGTASADPEPTAPATTPPPTPVLAEPTGPCSDSDVYITPSVPSPIGGQDVTILLNLQTRTSPACTWQLSPETMRLDVVSGSDQIWLSTECPAAVPSQEVVVRYATVTQVPVVWNARRSDEDCSDRTAWALPGFYHVRAAVLGGEPTDVQFELLAPSPVTVTETAQPQQGAAGS